MRERHDVDPDASHRGRWLERRPGIGRRRTGPHGQRARCSPCGRSSDRVDIERQVNDMDRGQVAITSRDGVGPTDRDGRGRGWRNRIVDSGTEAPESLAANPANWRVHPQHQKAALAGALDTVGWVQQVLVNRRSGYVVDGHARVALALARKEPSVPVLYVDLAPDEERLVLATLDPIGALAGHAEERLGALLADVSVDDAGLRALLDTLAAVAPRLGLSDPDDVPDLSEEPYVKPGELWRLGRHKLLCGDATDSDHVARLLDGAQPALTVADAPYGVRFEPVGRDCYGSDDSDLQESPRRRTAVHRVPPRPRVHFRADRGGLADGRPAAVVTDRHHADH